MRAVASVGGQRAQSGGKVASFTFQSALSSASRISCQRLVVLSFTLESRATTLSDVAGMRQMHLEGCGSSLERGRAAENGPHHCRTRNVSASNPALDTINDRQRTSIQRPTHAYYDAVSDSY